MTAQRSTQQEPEEKQIAAEVADEWEAYIDAFVAAEAKANAGR